MKPCRFCGKLIEEKAQYCLFCMKRQIPSRTLRIKKRVPFFGVALSLLVLLVIGGAVFLMEQPKQMANAAAGKADPSLSEELQSEGEKSFLEPESVQEESKAPFSSKEPVSEEGVSGKESETPHVSTGPEVNGPESGTQIETQDVWEEEPQAEPPYLSPEAYFEKVAAIEEEKLAVSLPGAVRTRQDLGSYSNRIVLEQETYALCEEKFEEAYSDSNVSLNLAAYTQDTFENFYGCGYGTTGQYNWKLIQADRITGSDGLPKYKIRVQIQTQVNDPVVTVSGVDTLEVVERVRQHLSQWGERIDVLPQQGNGEFLYVALDVEGLAPDIDLYVQSQEDMIAWLCAEVDTCREQRGMTRCRYDFRLVGATEREEYSSIPLSGFTFALYLEAA